MNLWMSCELLFVFRGPLEKNKKTLVVARMLIFYWSSNWGLVQDIAYTRLYSVLPSRPVPHKPTISLHPQIWMPLYPLLQ